MKIDFTKHNYKLIMTKKMSNKFQKKFFEAGGKWHDGDTQIFPVSAAFFIYDNTTFANKRLVLTYQSFDYLNEYSSHPNIEISYVDAMKALDKLIKKKERI